MPFESKSQNRLEIFNEVILLSILYQYSLLTFYVDDYKIKKKVGYVMVSLIALVCIVNYGIVIFRLIADRMNSIKSCFVKCKRVKPKIMTDELKAEIGLSRVSLYQ